MEENENSSEMIGPSGKIKRKEFVRIILQCLRSLGYVNTASCLESESGVSYKSKEFVILETLIMTGNLNASLTYLNSLRDVFGESIQPALFRVFKQCVIEHLKRDEITLALNMFRKWVSVLNVEPYQIHSFASTLVTLKGMGNDNDNDMKGTLLDDLELLLPPPISIPDGRLLNLIDTTVRSWVDACMYHPQSEKISVSLLEGHCGSSRDHFPTTTTQILTEHKNEVWFVQFSHNGEYLASSSNDCTAIIWKVQEDGKLTPKHILSGHQHAVSFVAWSPDDTKLLTCGNTEVLKLWDVETGTCMRTIGDEDFVVSSCAWFPNSTQFVCGSVDPEKGICMWDCDGNEIRAWRGMRMPKVVDLAVTPDGEHLISVFMDKEIRILHLATNTERVISEEHSITSLSVSVDSKFLLINLNNREIHMWDLAGKYCYQYVGHKQLKYVIRSCFGGLDSTYIASGSEDSQVYIWNRQSQSPIEVLWGHSQTVNSVSWNPKRPTMLASASDDHTVRIWGPRV